MLADRTLRVRLLVITIAVWGASMVVGGLAPDYLILLLSRITLGAAVAASGPVVASLIGDLFPSGERAKIYGWVLTGELVGAGLALLIGGDVAAWLSWRAPFLGLAALSLGLAAALWRLMPEPRRGGASRLPTARGLHGGPEKDQARETILHEGVPPERDRVLRGNPDTMTFWQAARYVLGIRTVRTLIIATAVGYFFFAGLRTFALIFALDRFGLSQGLVSLVVIPIGLGALAGTLFGGRLTDRALRRKHTRARVTVPAVAYSAAALFFLPGLLADEIWVSIAFFTLGACCPGRREPATGRGPARHRAGRAVGPRGERPHRAPARRRGGRPDRVRLRRRRVRRLGRARGGTACRVPHHAGAAAAQRTAPAARAADLPHRRGDGRRRPPGRCSGHRAALTASPSSRSAVANSAGGRWPNPSRNTRSDSPNHDPRPTRTSRSANAA